MNDVHLTIAIAATMIAATVPPIRNRKVGGIRFFRWGRLRFRLCIARQEF